LNAGPAPSFASETSRQILTEDEDEATVIVPAAAEEERR
jgi:hypothetical protein